MKILSTIIILFFLTYEILLSQNNFKRMTIISYEYERTNVKIDTSFYLLGIENTPVYRYDDWQHLGKSRLPILYSQFNVDRNYPKFLNDTTSKKMTIKSFNDLKNEWFVHEKRSRVSKQKVILWQTFYHEFHKMYFTEKIIMAFNNYGYLKEIITYDKYLKRIISREVYLYE